MKWPMLTRRGVTYYHREVVPLVLRPFLENRRELWKSLRTTDLEEAKLLSLRVGQEVARLFQSLRKKAAATQADPETFGRDFQRRALVEDAQWRVARGQVDDEQLDAELDGIIMAIENNEESLRLGDTKYVSKLLDEVLLEHGLHVPPSQRQAFAHALLRSRLEMLKVTAKRTQGEWDREPPQDQGITVEVLLDAYLGERKLSTKTEAEVRAGYRRFGDRGAAGLGATPVDGGEDQDHRGRRGHHHAHHHDDPHEKRERRREGTHDPAHVHAAHVDEPGPGQDRDAGQPRRSDHPIPPHQGLDDHGRQSSRGGMTLPSRVSCSARSCRPPDSTADSLPRSLRQ